MKICPHCQNRYTDDTLKFCLQDGAALIDDESQVSLPTGAVSEEQATVVRNRPNEPMNFDLQNSSPSQNRQYQTSGGTANYTDAPKKSNTGLIVLATILATLLIAGIGTAAWFYFGNKKEIVKDANIKNSFPDNSVGNENKNINVFSPPNSNEKPNIKPSPTATPAPDFNPEKVKSEVSETVDEWKSLAESHDLSSYMNNYGDTVDYYNKSKISKNTVRADKQKAFGQYDTIEFNLSNMKITPDASGESATAVFDKEWFFENTEKKSEGKVQTRLQFKKIGGAWKITGEKDLKVYYTN
ncbi:MAG: nuclear transport factor 2 family protein [Pyrinomonadaceae bacterium]